jgi:hypothetical protein
MPRARHVNDSSDNAGEVECEDGVEIGVTDILQFEEEERAEQLALEVQGANQPCGNQICEHDQHGDEEAAHEADDGFDLFG